jgi:hypothetical protein
MASTYVNDLRLNEMATGDESGNWGVVTNLNLELIGEALSFGTEAITTNADTHTTTVADGAADPGRAMYLKYTGTLDSACTITIAPNTISRMQFIENGTSGSQNIIISQGSGANVTIPAGDTKAVYLDGAGSGAAVVDAFASLNVVDLKVQDDLTVTDDATIGGTLGVTGIVTLTDDLIIGDGKTIGSASDVDAMTIASNGQITLTQTLIGTALDISGDIDVDGTTNLDVVDIDGAVDMASTLQVDGAITSSADLTLTSAGPAISLVDSDNNPDYQIKNGNGSLRFIDTTNTVDLATFTAGEVAINEGSADVDFRVESNGNANMLFVNAGTDQVHMGGTSGSSILNIESADEDHLRLINGSEVGLIRLTDAGHLDFWAHDSGETINFITGDGSGTIVMSVVGSDLGFGMTAPTFATGAGFHFADSKYLGLGTGNGTRPDFSLSGDNNGLAIACGTGSDDADILISTAGVMAVPNGIELGSGTDFTAANTLDDYEEGTWTGVITTTSTDFTTSSRGSDCKYTKIGDTVVAYFSVSIASPSSGSGDLKLTGLPFTSLSGNTTYRTGSIDWGRTDNAASLQVNGTLAGNATEITFTSLRDANTSLAFPASNMNGQVTPFFTGRIIYKTA